MYSWVNLHIFTSQYFYSQCNTICVWARCIHAVPKLCRGWENAKVYNCLFETGGWTTVPPLMHELKDNKPLDLIELLYEVVDEVYNWLVLNSWRHWMSSRLLNLLLSWNLPLSPLQYPSVVLFMHLEHSDTVLQTFICILQPQLNSGTI